MKLCLVTGTVTAPEKQERLRQAKLLLVVPLQLDGSLRPDSMEEVALDPHFDAGIGDRVLTAKQGTVVQQLMDADLPPEAVRTPANVIVVAVVDGISLAAPFPATT